MAIVWLHRRPRAGGAAPAAAPAAAAVPDVSTVDPEKHPVGINILSQTVPKGIRFTLDCRQVLLLQGKRKVRAAAAAAHTLHTGPDARGGPPRLPTTDSQLHTESRGGCTHV